MRRFLSPSAPLPIQVLRTGLVVLLLFVLMRAGKDGEISCTLDNRAKVTLSANLSGPDAIKAAAHEMRHVRQLGDHCRTRVLASYLVPGRRLQYEGEASCDFAQAAVRLGDSPQEAYRTAVWSMGESRWLRLLHSEAEMDAAFRASCPKLAVGSLTP